MIPLDSVISFVSCQFLIKTLASWTFLVRHHLSFPSIVVLVWAMGLRGEEFVLIVMLISCSRNMELLTIHPTIVLTLVNLSWVT